MKNKIAMKNTILTIFSLLVVFLSGKMESQAQGLVNTGLARIDITPEIPIRLTGYSTRDVPFEGISQKLWAKALAMGDMENLSVLITVDLLGIPGNITKEVRSVLAQETGFQNIQLAISASHTHSGPQIGNILSHFHKPLSPEELAEVAMYAKNLVPKLVQVALESIEKRELSILSVSWGKVDFAVNRRLSLNPNGPVDHSLPTLQVRSREGELRGIMVNYACHAVTFGPENNTVHGDWVGEAQVQIEANHPGVVAMVTIGCGADQNSSPRMNSEDPKKNFEYIHNQGKGIADEVERLLKSNQEWKVLSEAPAGQLSYLTLKFAEEPDPRELANDAMMEGRSANYSYLLLSRMARSEDIPMEFEYPVQVWNFGKDFTMVFLAGEVVVDYGLRIKEVLGSSNVWVNSYSNDMPCYIASRRVINEGGYEALSSMKGYEKPSALSPEVEEDIIHGIYNLLPETVERKLILGHGSDGRITLPASRGHGIGPDIDYMPKWKAFGWFRSKDKVEWNVDVVTSGEYEVWLEWSVSDEEAGKPFVLEVVGDSLTGNVQRSGSWETFKKEMIGTIQLESGKQKVVFRPGSKFDKDQALLDLKEVKLVPVK